MKAVVTGASGFIGQSLVAAMIAAGWEVLGVDRQPARARASGGSGSFRFVVGELADADELRRALAGFRPDLCVHLAGPSKVGASFADPPGDLAAHLLPVAAVLEWARLSSPATRVLIVSSAAVYGNPGRIPIGEQTPVSPISPYGYHCVMKEMLAREYRELFALRCGVARIFSVYGAGQRNLMLWDVGRRALQGDFRIAGTGRETRDYLHVDDVARALMTLGGRAPFAGEVTNVASGVERRVNEVVPLLYQALGIAERPQYSAAMAMPGSPTRWMADTTLLRSYGFRPTVDFAEGITETAQWIALNA